MRGLRWRWPAIALWLLVGHSSQAAGPETTCTHSLNPPSLSPQRASASPRSGCFSGLASVNGVVLHARGGGGSGSLSGSSGSAPLSSGTLPRERIITEASFRSSFGPPPDKLSPSPEPSPDKSPPRRVSGGQGILVPDMYASLNQAFHAARSPDVITLRSGTHQIGEHAIKGGQFHNNEPCYFEEEVVINKKLSLQGDITGTDKPVLHGKIVLQQPVDVETWKPQEGGGFLELMTMSFKDVGVHGFCLAIEGGCWLVQECEIRCSGAWSKAVWVYGGHIVFGSESTPIPPSPPRALSLLSSSHVFA